MALVYRFRAVFRVLLSYANAREHFHLAVFTALKWERFLEGVKNPKNIIHRMDDDKCWHVEQLAKHCRVCGNRLQKGKTRSTYACTNKKEELQLTFGVTVDNDCSTVHPSHFCNSCYLKSKRTMESIKKGEPYNPAISIFHWKPHSTETCKIYRNS